MQSVRGLSLQTDSCKQQVLEDLSRILKGTLSCTGAEDTQVEPADPSGSTAVLVGILVFSSQSKRKQTILMWFFCCREAVTAADHSRVSPHLS
jgi:hypothetical protein